MLKRPWTASGKAKQEAKDYENVIWHGVQNRCEEILRIWSEDIKRRPRTPKEQHEIEVVQSTSLRFGRDMSFEAFQEVLLGAKSPHWAAWHLSEASKYKPGLDRQRYLLAELDKRVTASFPEKIMSDWHQWWAENSRATNSKPT